MKAILPNKRLSLFLLFAGILSMQFSWAQTIDTTNVFDPPLTDVHLIYAEVVYNDVDGDNLFDCGFALSPVEIAAWGDYSTNIAFYTNTLQVRNGGSFVNTNTIPFSAGELIKLWIALNVPSQTYKAYAQTESMSDPQLIYEGDAAFRNTNVTSGINRWSAMHNGDGEPDSLSVKEIRLETNSDATLKSLEAGVGNLTPAFDASTYFYELDVPYGTTSIQFTPLTNGMGAEVAIYDGLGNLIEDGNVSFSGDGVDIEIIVTAFDGTEQSYYVSIYVAEGASDARLKEISVSESAIDPVFDPDVNEYTVIVPIGTSSVEVGAVTNYDGATVTGTGTVTLSGGSGSATLNVTSADGSETNSYTVTIEEADGNNYALYLPGSNGSNSNINITGLEMGDHPFTIEMWFKPEGTQEYNAGLLYQRPQNVGIQYVSSWQTPRDRVRFMTGIPDNYGTTSGNILADSWHHLAVVLTDSFRIVYLDGEMASEKISSPTIDYSDGEIYIGWDSDNNVKAFKGTIDEIRIWTDSLTAETLDANRLEVLTGAEANLLAYYNFDLNSPNVAIDLSPTAHHGVISGGTYVTSFPRVNVDLASLNVAEELSLKPAFNASISDYYITLPKESTTLDVTAVADDGSATVSGDGSTSLSGERGTITVTVTATSGESKDYNIHWVLDTDLTLMHSYTFANGTAVDVVGGVDGEIQGGSITEGVFTSAAEGDYIVLAGDEIGLNEYPSFTMEAWVTPGDNADNYTMLAYFGGLQSSNSFWMQLTRSGATESRIELNTNGAQTFAAGVEPGAAENHHYVAVVTNDSIMWYIDGTLAGKTINLDNSVIPGIDATNGWLGYGGWGDPTFIGSIYEFNIYSGVMDESTIAAHTVSWPLEDATSDASLADLTVDGTTIEGFAPYTLSYDYIMPQGSTTVPTLLATPTNANATVAVSDPASLPGTATVVVTAEDGSTTASFEVNYLFEISEDASLSGLTVDGSTIDGFNPDITSYTVTLPGGTTVVPTVAATPVSGASVVVTDATELPGTTTITVTAEDGQTTTTYLVNFILDISDDATLSDILIDGVSIDGFSPSTLGYQVELPAGTTELPVITAVANDGGATVVVNNVTSIPGNATIVVAAAAGNSLTYQVSFTLVSARDELKQEVKVYPSISDGQFNVQSNGGIYKLTVYNIAGSVVSEQLTMDVHTRITTPHEGIYILKVESDTNTQSFKLIHRK